MKWYYSPISIRFVNDRENHATSGINLILKNKDLVLLEYNLTINVIPIKSLKSFKIYISNSKFMNNDTNEIIWYQTSIDFNLPLSSTTDFLHNFKNLGFNILPQDKLTSSLFTSIVNLSAKLQDKLDYKPLEFIETKDHLPIDVISFPFNFTTPLLFSEFKSNGFINYFIPDGYLSDIKYLENSLGSVVTSKEGSVGLVMGNLKKFNGDGDLIIIVSWKTIWNVINNKFPNNSLVPNKLSSLMEQPPVSSHTNSVLPILVTGQTTTWGSCIIFNNQYLITNHHVIKPFLSGGSLTVYLSNDQIIIKDKSSIITPFDTLDISMIKLSLIDQFKIMNSGNKPCKYTTDYKVDDEVSAVGYGLFFHPDYCQPIKSFGQITNIKQLKLPEPTNALINTSSSCWNGSSGGGLFKNEQLIGIICSNAQVKYLDLTTNIEQLEKLTKLSFILPIDVILKIFHKELEMTKDFEDLWQLLPKHKDIIQLKLPSKL